MNITDLPNEILTEIALRLQGKQAYNSFYLTCRQFKGLLTYNDDTKEKFIYEIILKHEFSINEKKQRSFAKFVDFAVANIPGPTKSFFTNSSFITTAKNHPYISRIFYPSSNDGEKEFPNEKDKPPYKISRIRNQMKQHIINHRVNSNGSRYRHKTLKWIYPCTSSICHPIGLITLITTIFISAVCCMVIDSSDEYKRCLKNNHNNPEFCGPYSLSNESIIMISLSALTILSTLLLLNFSAKHDRWGTPIPNLIAATAETAGKVVQKVKNCFHREKMFS